MHHRAMRVLALTFLAVYASMAHQTAGHYQDFCLQWLSARLVVTGQGPQMYEREVQLAELARHYSPEFVEDNFGKQPMYGPTYPPTLGVLFAPLGLLSPAQAQWVVVELSLVLVLVASLALSRITDGRITWETAVVATCTLPPFCCALALGQNTALSLAIVTIGWLCLTRERPVLAGAVWGLFALKPTWGLAVGWIPLVVGRPRAYLGMAASAAALVALTLPACGIEGWLGWLPVAQRTEFLYRTVPQWTELSRDLPGVFRRFQQGFAVECLGWAAIVAVIGITAWTWRASGPRPTMTATGPRAVTLLAGSLLTCPRFMHYDIALAVVPLLIALADWRRLSSLSIGWLGLMAAFLWGGSAAWVMSYDGQGPQGPPLDTIALLGVWLWGVVSARFETAESASEPLAPIANWVPRSAT